MGAGDGKAARNGGYLGSGRSIASGGRFLREPVLVSRGGVLCVERRCSRIGSCGCLAYTNVLEDRGDDIGIFDAGDDAQRATALGAGLDVDGEDAFQALHPSHGGKGLIRLFVARFAFWHDALAMLAIRRASLFSCLDHPQEVLSYCQLSDDGSEPKLAAGRDLADIHVDYGAFVLAVEVSARKRVTRENYLTQTSQALAHAEALITTNRSRPIYVLVINNGSVENSHEFRSVYNELYLSPTKKETEGKDVAEKKDNGEKQGDIRLIPIWARDFAQIVSTLCKDDHAVGLDFDTGGLARAFEAIHEHFAVKKEWSPPGWTRAAFLAVLEGEPLPPLIEKKKDNEEEQSKTGAQIAAAPNYPLVLTWSRPTETIEPADSPDGDVPMDDAVQAEPQAEPDAEDPDSMPLRKGLSSAFLDFDVLPDLLAQAETFGSPEEMIEGWAKWLDEYGFEDGHLDPDELPPGVSAVQSIAADAYHFCELMGYVDARWLTEWGLRVAGMPVMASNRPAQAPADVVAEDIEGHLRGEGGAPILPLLQRAALILGETTNLWARECPGLIPAEVSAIVHWACVDFRRANELADGVVAWRDAAMHRRKAPDPDADPGANAQFHAGTVAEFYQEHSWLGEDVEMSLAAELALCRLLVYCGLLKEAW